METFSALLAICAGNSPVPGAFPTQRPVTRSFDVYFDVRPNKQLSKRSRGWWFETPLRPLWRHRNDLAAPMEPILQTVYWAKIQTWEEMSHLCDTWLPNHVTICSDKWAAVAHTPLWRDWTVKSKFWYTESFHFQLINCLWNIPESLTWE